MSKKIGRALALIAISALALSSQSDKSLAATMQIYGGTTVNASPTPLQDNTVAPSDPSSKVNTLPSGPTTISESLSVTSPIGTFQAATASASAEINAVTGQLKTSVDTTLYGSGGIETWLSEDFTVTGSGTVTAYLGVSGSYDVDGSGEIAESFQIQANIFQGTFFGAGSSHSPIAGTDNLFINQNNSSSADVVNHLITAELLISEGTSSLTLTTYLLAQISSGAGFINLSNTANFFIQTSEGLTLTPMDSRFLSNPAFDQTVVPLPAALPLLLSALGFFGFMGWRKKTAAAA